MSDWKSSLPHAWQLTGLPNIPETFETVYVFHIGHVDYIIPEGQQEVYLHIPEIPARDAEGRPLHPEQAEWIERILAGQRIHARDIWWSHWQFASAEDAQAFERHLQALGATPILDKQPPTPKGENA
ncbi:MAG: hypothetical protein ACOY0R_12145 [Chloroflexota bacterium]